METWITHYYFIPSSNASLENLQRLLHEESRFPDTPPPPDLGKLLEERRSKGRSTDIISFFVKINGVTLELEVLLESDGQSAPDGYGSVDVHLYWDARDPPPGGNQRLQEVLIWFFKASNALYMSAWGQDDEFSRPSPEEYTVEDMNAFPSGFYMLSKDLVRHVGGERVAALGPHGDVDGAGMWLRLRDDYYWPVDEGINARKTALLEEMWARWKGST